MHGSTFSLLNSTTSVVALFDKKSLIFTVPSRPSSGPIPESTCNKTLSDVPPSLPIWIS